MKKVIGLGIFIAGVGWGIVGCESSDKSSDSDVYPKFADQNANNINDYVEPDTHVVSSDDPRYHEYTDADGNGVCDYAEGDNPTWHGPGYIDEDSDGTCDYWETSSPHYQNGRRDIVHASDFDEVNQQNEHDSHGEGDH